MGSSSSLMVSPSSRKSSGFGGSRLNRTKRRLSFLFCGAASNAGSNLELEDYSQESSASSTKTLAPISDVSHNSIIESSSIFSSEFEDTSSTVETGESSGSDNSIVEEALVEQLNVKASRDLACLLNNKESVIHQPGSDPSSSLAHANSDSDVEYHQNAVDDDNNTNLSRIAEINSLEARRHSRRQFWDALSRRRDSRTMVFASGHADQLGSHDRWLLDIGGIRNDEVGHDVDSLSVRRHRRNEGRWLLRSEISERMISGLNEGAQQTTFCASGLHHEGTCSCDSTFSSEESSTLASISRIIMLAETLFEVLDEIQRQSLSLSPSTLSLPAPESVVDSFPLEYYEKQKEIESDTSDVQQCYICLADYEDSDKLRVLPCNHKYHVACIDKWLKEINRVCPLCRRNVCADGGECSASIPEVPSQ
ncbi:uncharacterized protein LOC111410894 isoform X2 [Olea europaea var. sylvestris]|uniref:uncharacterized protein LOC111410894 isoform X2 n=1 Tax=Olea europaea var. sylvestris TaxID=158386 RepID=UPI000C1D243C|nr:uncharacterized protein LOC111410894 isoform X2 [Olea europaea var. sylvestris]